MFYKKVNLFAKVFLCPHSRRTFKTSLNSFRIQKFAYSNIIVASAAAIGLSVYVAHKNKTTCDVDPYIENEAFNVSTEDKNYEEAIERSRDILQRIKDESGIPGLVIGVSIDGKTVWEEGFGYADVENRVICSPSTVMRIASISKSITMTAVAKLWEQGKLDLDKPVHEYVPSFPQKHFNGKPVSITCRQLVSHLGGIRHYNTNGPTNSNDSSKKKDSEHDEMELKEYFLQAKHTDLKSALDMFKDDPLVENPGSKFLYSTHGWTLISAIVEAVAKEQFTKYITKLFKLLGMTDTFLDENDVLIYNRSRNYSRNKHGGLINSPYVDNSYKWAGGGFLSTVGDLIQFANAMLYSFQHRPMDVNNKSLNTRKTKKNNTNMNSNAKCSSENIIDRKQLPGFLSNKTIEAMWQPIAQNYGMGWFVTPAKQDCQFCANNDFYVYHTGGAIGASSVLLIYPTTDKNLHLKCGSVPKGIVIALLCNMQSVKLSTTAIKIAKEFGEL